MPIFEYQCARCGASFERLCRRSAADLDCHCPACHAPARRIVSASALRLDGTVAAHRQRDADASRRERLALPVREKPPAVELGASPPVPQRYMKHMLKHGGC